ncbi:MAG: hypothetical protein QOC94_4826 [Actinoplanes sp.]|jgi:hypothetical protein|nr:hypothetical protein [Actinoplanes sp.]
MGEIHNHMGEIHNRYHCGRRLRLEDGATYALADAPLKVRADATPGKTAGYVAQLLTGDDFDDSRILDGLTRTLAPTWHHHLTTLRGP